MKNTVIKMLCVLLALCATLVSLPLSVFAAEAEPAAQQEPEQSNAPGYLEVGDGYIKIQVSTANGGFYIGLVEGDKLSKDDNNKNLLYPDSDYDTSFTSFRVTQNGVTRDYIFGRDYSYLGIDTSAVSVYQSADNAITAEWTVNGLKFTQIIAFMDTNSPMHGMAYVTYSVQNVSGGQVDSVKARVMMDTCLGYQDYAVYMLPDRNGSYTPITTERTVAGEDYNNFFYAYDSRTAPSTVAYTVNATVGNEVIEPERVTFAHWNNLASTEFDYEPAAVDPMDFTSDGYREYLTADSAVALYYDMGAPAVGEDPKAIGVYHGVYSNYTVGESAVSLNFINADVLKLNEDKTAYLDGNDGRYGNYTLEVKLQNVSDKEIPSMALAILPGEYVFPYDGNRLVDDATPQKPYYIQINSFLPGESRDYRIDFQIDATQVTDYRRIKLVAYNTSSTTDFSDANTVLEKETYVFCPGSVSAELGFTGMTPQLTGQRGTRFLYMTGTNFNLLRDKSLYRVVLRPVGGGDDVVIDSSKLVINPELNTATIVLDEILSLGTWQILIDWNDAQVEDVISDALRIDVLSDDRLDQMTTTSGIYSTISIKRSGNGQKNNPYHYEIVEGANENDENTLLVFKGNFNVMSTSAKGNYKAEAITMSGSDVINISNCLDVKNGRVTITVEYDEDGKQTAINVDIEGKVYTTGANTKVWDGICAITSIQEGELYAMPRYSWDGVRTDVTDAETLTLLWPGAASAAQNLVGMLIELRYCEFGVMSEPDGDLLRVVSFSAMLSPSFLIPNGREYNALRSPMEEEQVRIVYANYTASDLRRVDNRYEQSQSEWEKHQAGTLNMYIHDILFGGYFIGFNTSVEVGIPAFVEGMPYIKGTLSLKVMNDEWAFGVEGSADLKVFEMEASLAIRSYNGFPVLDKFTFFVGGFQPGVMVDPFGVFWIRGAGGGVDKLYETFFVSDVLPPITLMFSGEFAIFSILSTRADLSISLYGFEAALRNIQIAGIKLIDYLGGSVYWYPDFSLALRVDVNILDCIVGSGSITARKDFFEAYVQAGVKIPDNIWIVGGLEVGSASLGIGTQKVWGSVKVIGIGVGVTYYWGGDVDVDLLSTADDGSVAVPVYTDGEGNTLYMKTTNQIRTLGSSQKGGSGITMLSTGSGGIVSSSDMRRHSFTLNTVAAEDGLITVTYQAADAITAQDLRDSFSVSIGGEDHRLYWMDTSKPTDDPANANANAIFRYSEENGEATLSISLTDPQNQIGKEIVVSGGVASNIMVYGIERFADLDGVTLEGDTATVTGTDVNALSSVHLYAKNADGIAYQIGTADMTTATETSVQITVKYPESLPTGSYTVEAVGVLHGDNGEALASPTVQAVRSISFVNEIQPEPLTKAEIGLGGNYTLSLEVKADHADFEGYMVDIYEVNGEEYIPTVYTNVQLALDEVPLAGAVKTVAIGGRTETTDEEGNTVYTGLEAGKTYMVLAGTYKTSPDGSIVRSEVIATNKITMVTPVITEPVLSIEGSVSVPVGTTGVSVDTVTVSDLTVKVEGVGLLRSGYYILNDGERVSWNGGNITLSDLPDGVHSLSLGGVNETGDAFGTLYQFSVDTEAPALLISSPQGGGFYDSDSVTITGIAEAGAILTANAGNGEVTATVGADGSFALTVSLDMGASYQEVRITATDSAGNVSEPYGFTMTNMLLGDNDLELVVLLDGREVTHVAASSTPKQLTLAFKSGERYISINQGSVAAARIHWRSTIVRETANISNTGVLTGDLGAAGIVVATLDNHSAAVEVVPTSLQDVEISLEIPEGGLVYDGTAKEPTFTLRGADGLVAGVDYQVIYESNVNAGQATLRIFALDTGKCSGFKEVTFPIAAASINNGQLTVSEDSEDPENPEVTVTYNGKTLTRDVDYTVSYAVDEETGQGTVTVVGIGNYTGTLSATYEIDSFNHLVWIIPLIVVVLAGAGVAVFLILKKKKKKKKDGDDDTPDDTPEDTPDDTPEEKTDDTPEEKPEEPKKPDEAPEADEKTEE